MHMQKVAQINSPWHKIVPFHIQHSSSPCASIMLFGTRSGFPPALFRRQWVWRHVAGWSVRVCSHSVHPCALCILTHCLLGLITMRVCVVSLLVALLLSGRVVQCSRHPTHPPASWSRATRPRRGNSSGTSHPQSITASCAPGGSLMDEPESTLTSSPSRICGSVCSRTCYVAGCMGSRLAADTVMGSSCPGCTISAVTCRHPTYRRNR